jgi:hypothetical protein
MCKKIIKIEGAPTVKIRDSFDVKELYPNGTKRIVEIFTLFYGWIRTEEVSEIKYMCGSDGTLYYNDWKQIRT